MRKAGEEDREPLATVAVRVAPRAAKDEVDGYRGGALRVRLTAPPVEDRANEALVRFLARSLDVPRACVEIAVGSRSRIKLIRVRGIGRDEVFRRLGLQEPAD